MLYEENKTFSTTEKEKLSAIIKVTGGSWSLPLTPRPYKYKMNFEIELVTVQAFGGIQFSYITAGKSGETPRALGQAEIQQANNYFKKATDLLRNEKYEKAVQQFIKCLEVDSLFMDAYYNLAFCYQKLGNKELACENWSKLKEMGQKQGESLYNENCR